MGRILSWLMRPGLLKALIFDIRLAWRLLRVPLAKAAHDGLVTLLTTELGTDSIERAKTYLEEPLRMTVHLIMSTPEYQFV